MELAINKKIRVFIICAISTFFFINMVALVNNQFRTENTTFESKNKIESSRIVGDSADIYGLLMGVEDYAGTSNDLDYPEEDVNDLRSMIRNTANGRWPFWSSNSYCTVLKNENVNEKNITDAFNDMATKVDNNDLFILQYSGHGGRYTSENYTFPTEDIMESSHDYSNGDTLQWILDLSTLDISGFSLFFEKIELWNNDNITIIDFYTSQVLDIINTIDTTLAYSTMYETDKIIVNFTANSDGLNAWGFKITAAMLYKNPSFTYLCPYDSLDPSSSNYDNNYLTPTWLDNMLDKINGKILVILDACHSGGFITGLYQKRRCILTSALAQETCLELGTLQNGLFTYTFISAYENGYDPDSNGIVTLEEAIYNSTQWTLYESRLNGNEHNPQTSNNLGDDFNLLYFQDSDGDGISDTQEIADQTNPFLATSNKRANAVLILSNVLIGLFFIIVPVSVILMFYLHKNHKLRMRAFIETFPSLEGEDQSPFLRKDFDTFNALEIIESNTKTNTHAADKSKKTQTSRRNPLSLMTNKGETIIIKDPKEILLPLKCVCTNETLEISEKHNFPIQECKYTYPSNIDLNKEDRRQYAVKVPITEDALLEIEEKNKNNQSVFQILKIGFLADFGLMVLLTLISSQRLASILFWFILFGLIIITLYKLDHVISIEDYFMATRYDENSIEIQIKDNKYAEFFKRLNKIEDRS
ncbi:MAG: hypothetical protein GF364_00680 [Candidatus Lokiarchaeota archaeon]|nr:hypothetical protein [Candidatus Lokiarchaeota archaeon]